MTPLQKLQISLIQLQNANVLELREAAIDAMGYMVELAREIISDAEMSNAAMQQELQALARRVAQLEAQQAGEIHVDMEGE